MCIGATTAAAQEAPDRPLATTGQVLSFAGAGAFFATSVVLDLTEGPPHCAPCDPADVPSFDRWVIRPAQTEFARASDVLLIGLGGTTLWDTWRGPDGPRRSIITLEAVAWSLGVVELSKALIGRERPVMYTDDAIEAADKVKNLRSMPSGHTALAFAFATSYWLNNPERGVAPKVLAIVAAAGVGVSRVAAAKHFPSDVVVGAALGTLSAVVIHEIRF